MKQFFTILAMLFATTFLQAQNRLVINADGFIVISSGAFLVIDNPNTNAITVAGAGGNILSEAEDNRVKWNIAVNSGAYTVPFASKAHVKIPLTIDVITSGADPGFFLFSTYTDNDAVNSWDNDDYKPTGVTNMQGKNGLVNNSPYVVDRFWVIENQLYELEPTATIDFGYDLTNEVTSAGNFIAGGNLVAQYYDEAVNTWVHPATGTDNLVARRVENASTAPINGFNTDNLFYKVWTLTGKFNILPIELLDFVGTAKEGFNLLEWRTVSELDNDYFELERSTDATNWQVIAKIDGAGTSTQIASYQSLDKELVHDLYYYRIKQVDFDGKFSYTKVISIENLSTTKVIGVTGLYPNPAKDYINFSFYSPTRQEASVIIIDGQGRIVKEFRCSLSQNYSTLRLNIEGLARGYYVIKIASEQNAYQMQKAFIKK